MVTKKMLSESDKLLKTFCRICPDMHDELDFLTACLKHRKDENFVIANAGPMNPGKSTLFNSLLDEPEAFRVADRRETVECKEILWQGKYSLLDTPGFASSEEVDDTHAIAGLRTADMVLFVHNINTGGLTNAELKLLQVIKEHFASEISKRVWMICTRADEVTEESVLESNVAEIKEQLQVNLAVSLPMFKVAPTLHFKALQYKQNGRGKDAELLEELSGIEILKNTLQSAAAEVGKFTAAEAMQALNKKLRDKLGKFSEISAKSRRQWERRQEASKTSWAETLEAIRPSWNECK